MREWILENTTVTSEEYDSLINENTINNEKETGQLSDNPLVNIHFFTLKKDNFVRRKKYKVLKIKNYYMHKNIKFYILAEIIKDLSKKLYTTSREGECFTLNGIICNGIEDSRIITAMCIDPFHTTHEPYLHTFTVVPDNHGTEFVFDGTLNAIILKETYLELYQAKIISEIESKQYHNDLIYTFANHGEEINIEEYLCFPEQVVTAAKKIAKSKK